MKLARFITLSVVGTALGLGLGVGAHLLIPESPYVRGLFIGERRLPDGVSAASWLAERREVLGERTVFVRYGDFTEELTFAELGVDVDFEATLARAAEVGHRGSVVDRVKENLAARRGEVDVPIVWRVSRPKMERVIERAGERVKRSPKDARIDIAGKKRIPDEPGRELDADAALRVIAETDYGAPGLLVVDLPVDRVDARVTEAMLAEVDVTKVLSSYETRFSPYISGRSANVARAASLIDGAILPPGETLSFNELVGPRTLERGFHWAPEIQGDELTTGVGGGTCQVSSTLFAAAVFGAMDVVERKSHSQVAAYVKMGLDATVSFPSVDLKIKNPYTYPVMLHAFLPKPGLLRVEILGGQPTAEVSYAYGVGHVEDFVRRITVKHTLKPGTKIRRQKGSRGYEVTSVVTIRWPNGNVDERRYYSGYRPAPEVYWVSPDYDQSQLPPLPAHAKGIEGQLAENERVYDGDALTF